MLTNYHTHTYRCKHATGTDEEYVRAAVDAGFSVLGFSDHAPFYYPNGFVSHYKMTPGELPEYVGSVLSLKEKYKSEIDVRLGLEVEYYPELWDRALELWETCGIEYIILGQHYVGKEYLDARRTIKPSDDDTLCEYVRLCTAAMKTGKISYLAHPDVINHVGNESLWTREMTRLIECAMEYDVPLEFNLLGLFEGRNYPTDRFWRLAGQLNPKTVIGNDAHTPKSFLRADTRRTALDVLEGYGLKPQETLEFKRI